jgi:fucose 4-O-acetylase-like acetyltransferase
MLLPASPSLLFLHRTLYAFHMPLFFFLSGLLAARSVAESTTSFIAARVRTVAYPYVVWSVLQALVLIALSPLTRDRPDGTLLLRLPLHPLMQFWFLYALFAMSLIFAGLHVLGLRGRGVALVSVALYAIVPFAGLRWEVAQAIGVFFVYFGAGVWLSPRLLGEERPGLGPAGAGVLLALLAVMVALGLDERWASRPLAAAAGIAATMSAAAAISAAGRLGFFHAWGRSSLPIYVAHLIPVIGCRVVLLRLGMTNALVHLVAGLAAGLGGSLLIVQGCERAGFRHAFVLGGPARRTVAAGGAQPRTSPL